MTQSISDNGRLERVCVVTPDKDAYSATFIRAHIERLPFDVEVIGGGWRPIFDFASGTRIPRASTRLIVRGVRLLGGSKRLQHSLLNRGIATHLTRNAYQVVLAEYGPVGAEMAPICARAEVPLVVHFHGFDASKHEILARWQDRYEYMFQTAFAIVVPSEMMKETLVSIGAPPKVVVVSPYGVDLNRFAASNPGVSEPTFVAVGRFVEKKAPYLTILSFAKAAQTVSEMKLVMIGDGPLFGPCEQIARAFNVHDRVQFLGIQDPDGVARALQKARGFVQHSLTARDGDSEGLPLAVLEASACGLPVVSTTHAGIPEAVIHGTTGLLSPERDVNTMASNLVALALNPEMGSAMGKAARKRARECFNVEDSIARLARVLRNAIESWDSPLVDTRAT